MLSLPPAFALSQDQTLKLDLKLLNRLITTFDEVPPFRRRRFTSSSTDPIDEKLANRTMVLPLNVYRRSLSSDPDIEAEASSIETRKDSAVHVSLSSYSVVKQPGAETPLSPLGESLSLSHPTPSDNRITVRLFGHSSQ